MDRLGTEAHVAAILNAAWMVRHYRHGGRSQLGESRRRDAILRLGLVVQKAFNESPEFETLLGAVVSGLSPKEPDF